MRCSRFLACARVKLWWMHPAWGAGGSEFPAETQLLLLELGPGGPYAVLLPLPCDGPGGGAFRCSLRGAAGDTASLHVVLESGCADVAEHTLPRAVVVAGGWEPFEAVKAAVRCASGSLGTFSLREDKPPPPMLDTFGWCTWDAFYHGVSAEGVSKGLAALSQAGAPPKFLILDDGWQTVAPDAAYRPPPPGAAARAAAWAASPSSPLLIRLPLFLLLAPLVLILCGFALLAAADHPRVALFVLCCAAAPKAASALRLASRVERLYWARVHTLPYGGRGWRALAWFAREPSVRRRIRAAAASMSTFTHRLTSLGANTKFGSPCEGPSHGLATAAPPGGLAGVVSHVREAHGISHVYVWHALAGYWGGVDPTDATLLGESFGVAMAHPEPPRGLLEVEPSLAWDMLTLGGVGLVAPQSAARFYDALHSGLASCGVDGVKVDAQAVVGLLGAGRGGGARLARDMHAALNESVARHFSPGHAINCMCHSSDDVFAFGATAMARVSDDFFPRNPASWTAHVVACAYNSLFMGEVVYPDWDMFHSQHPAAWFHAAARAVAGCAVYVSDAPGKHDAPLLRSLVLPAGRTLRALLPGRPTRDCLFVDVCRDGVSALKVWNVNSAGGGVVGVFNCQGGGWDRQAHQFVAARGAPPRVTAAVAASDVPGLGGGGAHPGAAGAARFGPGDFALYCHTTKSLSVLPPSDSVAVCLDAAGWEVVTMAPVKRPCGASGPAFAAIGLTNMLNSGGAVVSCEVAARVQPPAAAAAAAAASAHGGGASKAVGRGGVGGGGAPVSSPRVVDWVARVALRGGGTFAAFSNARPRSATVSADGGPAAEVPFSWRAADGLLTLAVPEGAERADVEVRLDADPPPGGFV